MKRELSHRERQVLFYLAEGFSDAQIAHQIGVEPSTVAHHLHRVKGKLRAKSRAHMVALWFRAGAPAPDGMTARGRPERQTGTSAT